MKHGIIKGLFLVIATVLFMAGASAQERNDVIQAYNEGAKVTKTDPAAAITAFEKAIELADKVGDEAADLKANAIKVLPGLYFRVAYNALNEKKPADEVIRASKKAIEIADKYNSAANKTNALKVISSAYGTKASEMFANNDLDNALLTFDSLLAVNPGFASAYYNKALIYIKQNNSEAFESTIDIYLDKLKTANDTTRAKQASKTALEYFRAAGSQLSQTDKLDDALAALGKAAKYGEDKDLNYFFADVYNKQGKFSEALDYAQKGLGMEAGDANAKAKFYFQIGLAQEGKGNTAEACASFKNALFGPFAEPSKAKRTNLKCAN